MFQQKWAVGGFVLSFLAAIGFTFNNLGEAIYFDDPTHQNVELRSWMTPRYISLSYGLPRPVVLELLNIEEGFKSPKRLDVLAGNLGISLGELTEKVREEAVIYRESSND